MLRVMVFGYEEAEDGGPAGDSFTATHGDLRIFQPESCALLLDVEGRFDIERFLRCLTESAAAKASGDT